MARHPSLFCGFLLLLLQIIFSFLRLLLLFCLSLFSIYRNSACLQSLQERREEGMHGFVLVFQTANRSPLGEEEEEKRFVFFSLRVLSCLTLSLHLGCLSERRDSPVCLLTSRKQPIHFSIEMKLLDKNASRSPLSLSFSFLSFSLQTNDNTV